MKQQLFRYLTLFGILLLITIPGYAQQYTGTTGLIHVPSAEMNKAGTAQIGGHFLNKKFAPTPLSRYGTRHTESFYISLTPFSWVELGYTCTLMGGFEVEGQSHKDYHKDQYFTLKLNPLKEGKWWPALALGINDPDQSGREVYNNYFSNYYLAATKHLSFAKNEIGVHLSYRKWDRDYNQQWDGIVGGITFRPAFAPNLRAITEYTGNEINIGMDCLLWKHLFIQGALQKGKYFSGGICYRINLL